MMKFTLLSILGFAAASLEQQIMILFDVTRLGLKETELPSLLSDALEAIVKDDGAVSTEIAISHFADKPAPYVGIGSYGGFPGPYKEDWCYGNQLKFTKDVAEIHDALLSLPSASGLDPWEGQFEAMVHAAVDPKVGWKDSAEKIVVMVSDSYGHSGILDRLVDTVTLFNEPVRCVGANTRGGFGATATSMPLGGWVANEAAYNEYAKLLHKHSCVADLTTDEKSRFDTLRDSYPVRRYPTVQPFNLEVLKNDPDTHCRYHEYPTYDHIREVYNNLNMKFFLIFADPKTAAKSYSDDVVWNWVLGDAVEGLGHIPNVLSIIPDLAALKALAAPTDSNAPPTSLEAIIRSGLKTLTQ